MTYVGAPRTRALLQACERPDVVEVWDVTAADPKLLVSLKVGAGPASGSRLLIDS